MVVLMLESVASHRHYRGLVHSIKFNGVHNTIDKFHACMRELQKSDTKVDQDTVTKLFR